SEQAIPEAAKPARPRPVIKRPAALQKPDQETEKPTEAPTTGIESGHEATASEAPQPPRPRPVIKRPTALQKPADTEKPIEEGIAPTEEDSAPATSVSNQSEGTTPSTDIATAADTASQKPPRPRP